MITISVSKVEGLNELNNTLRQLPKAVARNTLRKVLIKRAKPFADTMRNLAPDDPNTPNNKDLKGSIGVGTKLSKRQARLHRKEHKDDKQFAEVFVGAGPLPQAHMNEWGTINMSPQPFGRPAWEENRNAALEGLKDDFWSEIKKAADRYAKRMARKVK